MLLPPPNGLVTLTTDFGLQDPYVGVMKAEVKRRHPRAEIIDLCHYVPAHDIAIGSMFLEEATRFPTGTVHVAVVDPGVGTARRALAACARGAYWIAPDNGVLSAVLSGTDEAACEVRELDLAKLQLPTPSRTFWGRDVFAPVAGMLSGGRYGYRAVGPRAADVVRVPSPVERGAVIVAIDHFGNLITGVRAAEVRDQGIASVEIGDHRVPVRETYGAVAPGAALALINSYELLEIAVREGRADERLAASVGDPVTLSAEEVPHDPRAT
ncbi:MAG: SAM-dependent chlorinase/fluorinase [Planctomycetota bacterium]